jgi:hypothetical protein
MEPSIEYIFRKVKLQLIHERERLNRILFTVNIKQPNLRVP